MSLPNCRVLEAFDDIASPILDAIAGYAEESRTLGKLRDTLLPKLISGELRIASAEQRVAAA
jgi:type I restriction enzyme, S subunit